MISQNLREIVQLFEREKNVKRLIFRIIRRFGPIDSESICYFCAAALLCSDLFPDGLNRDFNSILLYMSIEYNLNLNALLAELLAIEYIAEYIDIEIKYIATNRQH